MYLKRLESAGFKSFAERINVEFVPGVTAVVALMEAAKVTLPMPSDGFSANNQLNHCVAPKCRMLFFKAVTVVKH
ncbi:hypothetical protein JNUCC1_03878 [Lentibacillus sp. JNUCC-1]|uniref:hypothetical protein n=1 Tax=Lentibacillus sp. JNUCC-1 TaxID=2654513 RepID=UPI00132303CF|nr:hypothetical protein [Lentibacillus sp. JNUCC-1]